MQDILPSNLRKNFSYLAQILGPGYDMLLWTESWRRFSKSTVFLWVSTA